MVVTEAPGSAKPVHKRRRAPEGVVVCPHFTKPIRGVSDLVLRPILVVGCVEKYKEGSTQPNFSERSHLE